MWRVGTSFSLLSGGTPGCALSTFNSGSWRAASFSTRGGEGPRICIPGLDSDCLVLLKLRLRPQLLQPPPLPSRPNVRLPDSASPGQEANAQLF